MRLLLRTLGADGKPDALIAETEVHEGDLWIEIVQVAYNAAYGYADVASREIVASTFLGGVYPFGQHTLMFGRYGLDTEPECDAPVWMLLTQ